ncbi:site-specific DNA-methyltransferase [Collinsella tanakaei]|uniref:site-specific DNA-methyltransferase n=1 Tax=Collinsella tanakaei TaxID=626935 RepID=UPI0025A416C6|nr:site-specific DNA-methyltransferase [Collinsella tanakaei]MDM8301671.1 site-specific DNA-methyltransferase [Collinsella tanakaei]
MELEPINLESENLVSDRIDRIRELFPEVFSEGGIDFDKLKLELGGEVDDSDERYAFTWPGKRDAIRLSQTVSTATLRPCVKKSRSRDGEDVSFDSDNLYIEGDNLEVLKLLQRAYHGKVKMIYIDPPYNTGHDFVYHDSFGDTIENYKEQAGLACQSNADTSGRYHADWCSMMYPRLRLARELLTDDGAIFISIDDNESANLRKICDEVFGESNFRSDISWQKRYTRSNNTVDFTTTIEHIFVYSRSDSFHVNLLPRDEASDAGYTNPDNDPRGPWITSSYVNPARKEDRPNLVYSIEAPDGRVVSHPANAWKFSKEEHQRHIQENLLWWGLDGHAQYPRLKLFLKEARGLTPINFWKHEYAGNTDMGGNDAASLLGKKYFDYPKPVLLMKRVLEHASSSECTVLDFFSGSGSMAEAVMRLNFEDGGARRFVMVQLPEKIKEGSDASRDGYCTICQLGEERIRRAGDKIKAELEDSNRQLKLGEEPKQLPDIGFRVFKLDESGIRKPEPDQLLVDCVKPDRSELDIVFEMMLKWGLELTLPVEREELAGYPCYTVAYGELVCCLAPGLTVDALEAIAKIEPRRVLMLDRILDDSLKLNAVQTFKRVEERAGREVELRTV